MRALCAELGDPERAYRSVHVVGTNGKSSVTLMTAALLEGAGLRTGACISPHTQHWRERTRVGGVEIGAAAFARAAAEVEAAIAELEPRFADGARITQFEAAIAISLVAFRDAAVDVAVVEAGLGGRLDATNVIASEATALTSIGLDHTDWLGDTVEAIAGEKLAVLEPATTLVIGALPEPVEELARDHAEALGAAVIGAPAAPAEAVPPRFGPYLRRNAGVALALAGVVLGTAPTPAAAREALEPLRLGGRFELVEGDPAAVFDAAHNREGAAALAEALGGLDRGPVVLCVSVLADKDAAGIAAELAPLAGRVICTAADPGPAMGRPGAVALDPAELAGHFRAAGAEAEPIADAADACRRALRLARESGGVAVFAGSHYLLRHAWIEKRDQSSCR